LFSEGAAYIYLIDRRPVIFLKDKGICRVEPNNNISFYPRNLNISTYPQLGLPISETLNSRLYSLGMRKR